MAEGRLDHVDRGQWNHTAHLLAMMVNTMPFKKSARITRPGEMNPYENQRSGTPITAANLSTLTAAMTT